MTWPTLDPEILLGGTLTGSPSTWPNWGSIGGSATINGSPTIENGGINPGGNASNYAELDLTGNEITVFSLNAITVAVRFMFDNNSPSNATSLLFNLYESSSSAEFQVELQSRNSNTQWRSRADYVPDGSFTTSLLAASDNTTGDDTEHVMVIRLVWDGTEWDVAIRDFDGLTTNSIDPVTEGNDPTASESFNKLRVGVEPDGSDPSTVAITGVAVWYDDIGDTEAAAISASDAEWETSPATTATPTPSTIAATTAIGAPTITADTAPSPAAIAATAAISTPTITLGGNADPTPSTIAATTAIGTPTVQTTGDTTVSPTAIAATAAIGTPTIGGNVDVTVASPIAVTTTMLGPTVITPLEPQASGFEALVLDLDGTELAWLDGIIEASFEDALSEEGAFRIVSDFALPDWSETWATDLLAGATKAVRIYVDGVPRFGGVIDEIDETVVDENGEERILLAGRGWAATAEWATVIPSGYPGSAVSSTIAFSSTPAMAIFKSLFDAADARSVGWPLSLGFSATADSDGSSWTDSQDEEIRPGGDLLAHLRRYSFLGDSDWHVDPTTLVVDARRTWGSDLTGSIRFEKGLHLRDLRRRHNRRSIRNAPYLEGKEGLISSTTDATSISDHGRRETYIGAGTAMSSTTRDAYLTAALEIAKDPLVEYELDIADSRWEPWADFDLGDTVGVYDPERGINTGLRILSITARYQSDGTVTYGLVLASRFQNRIGQLTRAMQTLNGLVDAVDANVQFPAPVRIEDTVGELTVDQIGAGAITETLIADNAISTPKLQTNAVTTDRIAAGSITTSLLAANAVTAAKIAARTITADRIVLSSITSSELGSGSVTETQITSSAVTTSKIASNAITAAKIAANTITASEIAASTITATQIASNAITAAKIASNAVTTSKLDAGSVTASKIAVGTITADRIAAGTLSSASGVFGTISANDITTGTLNASNVTITNLSASSISTGTMSADRISGGTIDASNISGVTISGTTISGGTITGTVSSSATITGGTIRTATSGARVQMSGTSVAFYYSGGLSNTLEGTSTGLNLNGDLLLPGGARVYDPGGDTQILGGDSQSYIQFNEAGNQLLLWGSSGVVAEDDLFVEGTVWVVGSGGGGGSVYADAYRFYDNTDNFFYDSSGSIGVAVDGALMCYFDTVAGEDRIHLGGETNDYWGYDPVTEVGRFAQNGVTAIQYRANGADIRMPALASGTGNTFQIGTTSYQLLYVTSTVDVKERLAPIGDSLHDAFMAVRPQQFDWKRRNPRTGHKHHMSPRAVSWDRRRTDYGLIAEEVAQHLPELAFIDSDGPAGLNDPGIRAVLWAETQYAHRRADAAEARADQLERALRQLADRVAALEAA